jgi:hypothetical protein
MSERYILNARGVVQMGGDPYLFIAAVQVEDENGAPPVNPTFTVSTAEANPRVIPINPALALGPPAEGIWRVIFANIVDEHTHYPQAFLFVIKAETTVGGKHVIGKTPIAITYYGPGSV